MIVLITNTISRNTVTCPGNQIPGKNHTGTGQPFPSRPPIKASTSRLIFKGINYRAEVWLNGTLLADSAHMVGMFEEFDLDASAVIHAGAENALAVKIYPLDDPGLPSTPAAAKRSAISSTTAARPVISARTSPCLAPSAGTGSPKSMTATSASGSPSICVPPAQVVDQPNRRSSPICPICPIQASQRSPLTIH